MVSTAQHKFEQKERKVSGGKIYSLVGYFAPMEITLQC